MRLDWDVLGTAAADAAYRAEVDLAGVICAAAQPAWCLLAPEHGCCVGLKAIRIASDMAKVLGGNYAHVFDARWRERLAT